jgi:hypothetical protein
VSKRPRQLRRSESSVAEVEDHLDRIAKMNIEELRALWRQRRGVPAPEALSKDLIARVLAHDVQIASLGDLEPRVRKLMASPLMKGSRASRYLKIGSVIVREHNGQMQEVMVVSGGFSWQGRTYSSLSTIAKAMTGTSWNGPRFFGLRAADSDGRLGEDGGIVSEAATRVPRRSPGTSPPGSMAERSKLTEKRKGGDARLAVGGRDL